MDKRTTQLRHALSIFLPLIGVRATADAVKISQDSETEYSLDICAGIVGVDTGYQVPAPRLGHPQATAPGYRVYFWKTTHNYPHAPDDAEDVTFVETLRLDQALEAVGTLIAREAARHAVQMLPGGPEAG